MMKSFELFKKAFWTFFTGVSFVGLLFVVSCDSGDGNDPEPELYDLSGYYTFKKATLTAGAEGIADAIGIPAGLIPTDITDAMAGGLLAEAPCDDPENGAVELKSNNQLYFACIGEANELAAGTWDINSDTTELEMNLSVPQALKLTLNDLEIDESADIISGTISNFPINKTLLEGFLGPPLTEEQKNGILAGIDENFVTLITVDIEFQKVTE